jgi:hypothetical protein
MSAPERAGRRAYGPSSSPKVESRPSAPKLSLGTSTSARTSIGLGVPVAPSFLDLEEEQTVAYSAPGVTLSALLAECGDEPKPASPAAPVEAPTTPSHVRPRGSFHTVPNFPKDSNPDLKAPVESNIHHFEADKITDTLSPRDRRAEAVHMRIGVRPPASIRPRSFRPTRPRSFLAKFLVLGITIGIALLIASELSAAANMSWLDPRPALTKIVTFAKEKIPWQRLPKLPKF